MCIYVDTSSVLILSNAMSSVQTGRQKRPLFSGQRAFKQFIVEESDVITPASPKANLRSKIAQALAFTIATAGTTGLGIWLGLTRIIYAGMFSTVVIILWFVCFLR